MRAAPSLALFLGLAVALGCQERPAVVTARQLLTEPVRYDGERVAITGVVQNPRKRLPPEGNGYTSFTLLDGADRVLAVAWGTEDVRSGDVVEARGVFRSELRAGGDVLHDVVEAAFVRPLRRAARPPGTPAGPP